MKVDDAQHYINKIRKPAKKAYAEQYWYWLLKQTVHNTQEEAPQPSNISVMGAQAVRIQLHSFTK